MIVRNMRSARGNEVPNQFIIDKGDVQYFQSYRTMIAKKDLNGKVTLDKNNWDYSRTTGKYRNLFLGIDSQETKRRIKSGDIKLCNLN